MNGTDLQIEIRIMETLIRKSHEAMPDYNIPALSSGQPKIATWSSKKPTTLCNNIEASETFFVAIIIAFV